MSKILSMKRWLIWYISILYKKFNFLSIHCFAILKIKKNVVTAT